MTRQSLKVQGCGNSKEITDDKYRKVHVAMKQADKYDLESRGYAFPAQESRSTIGGGGGDVNFFPPFWDGTARK